MIRKLLFPATTLLTWHRSFLNRRYITVGIWRRWTPRLQRQKNLPIVFVLAGINQAARCFVTGKPMNDAIRRFPCRRMERRSDVFPR
jgi:hypothetical protein